jgi:hypothetical protein
MSDRKTSANDQCCVVAGFVYTPLLLLVAFGGFIGLF